jgi:hypothetical protein
MPHLIEEYARNLGVRVEKPPVALEYIPIPFSKYVVFCSGKTEFAFTYDYFSDVLRIVCGALIANGYGFVQIGNQGDQLIEGCFDARGCTFKQAMFLVANSELVVANNSVVVSFADAMEKKTVALYGNVYPENFGPYFCQDKTFVIQPDFNEKKPTLQDKEAEKRVNEIMPEVVAQAILIALDLEHMVDLSNLKTFFIGSSYNTRHLEVVPNFPPVSHDNEMVVLRGDLLKLYPPQKSHMGDWLAASQNIMLIIDSAIDLRALAQFREKIKKIVLIVDKGMPKAFIEDVSLFGVDFLLVCEKLENLDKTRLELLDYKVYPFHREEKQPKGVEVGHNIRTNRLFASKGKLFLTEAHLRANMSVEHPLGQKVIGDALLWQDSDFLMIYGKKKDRAESSNSGS